MNMQTNYYEKSTLHCLFIAWTRFSSQFYCFVLLFEGKLLQSWKNLHCIISLPNKTLVSVKTEIVRLIFFKMDPEESRLLLWI